MENKKDAQIKKAEDPRKNIQYRKDIFDKRSYQADSLDYSDDFASYDFDENHMQTASATEFTGLIPAGITYDEEADMYDELCPYLPPKVYIQGFGDLEK